MEARELTLVKVEKPVNLPSSIEHPKYDADSILNCPHDMSHLDASVAKIEQNIAATGLVATTSSMFGSNKTDVSVPLKKSPSISAFHSTNGKTLTKNTAAKVLAMEVKKLFSSPFKKFISDEKVKDNKVRPQHA